MLRATRAKPCRPEPFLVHFQRLQEKVYVFALQVFCFVLCVPYFKPLLRYLQLGSVDVQRHVQVLKNVTPSRLWPAFRRCTYSLNWQGNMQRKRTVMVQFGPGFLQASLQLFMLPFARKPVLTHFQFTALFRIILTVGNECEKFLPARTLKTAKEPHW